MKTASEILNNFLNADENHPDAYYKVDVIKAMEQYASQFFTEEQVREAAIEFSIYLQEADGIPEVRHATEDLYDGWTQLNNQNKKDNGYETNTF